MHPVASFQLFLGGAKFFFIPPENSRGGTRRSFINSRGVVGEVFSIREGVVGEVLFYQFEGGSRRSFIIFICSNFSSNLTLFLVSFLLFFFFSFSLGGDGSNLTLFLVSFLLFFFFSFSLGATVVI